MDLVSGKLKDKRNRVLERETNELKDELMAMRHIVHLLDNIKRVSNDCISFLHLMVDAALKSDSTQLDQLRDDVRELEEELKVWERKYELMSNIQTMPSIDHNIKRNNNNKHNIVINNNNNNNNTSINSSINTNNITANDSDVNELDGYEVCGNGTYYDSDKNEDCAQSSSHNSLVLMPQELCEMSMETNENDEIVITNADANTPTLPSSQLSSSLQLSSGKSLFECDWIGCDFRTNMRQRLVMHKRLHAGEMLFSCDVEGCGYQSNYKGNIKIHKKHRHRIDSDDCKEYSTPHTLNNNTTTNISNNLIKNNYSTNMIRKRKRKKKFRFTMNRTNVSIKPSMMTGLRDGSVGQSAKDVDRMSSLFSCNVKGCNYRSKWKQCLTAHQLLHAGVKPFKCDHPGCNYRTNFKGNVNVHKRVHRESQFQCQVSGCQFSTPWKNSFNQHQRNHFINKNDNNIVIDNNIEQFEIEHNSNENEFDYDEEEEDEESFGDNDEVKVHRREGSSLPLIPVQHIQTLSTNELTATQQSSVIMNSTLNAQQTLVPPIAGVIKTEI
jgi:hypothetical protein